MNWLTASQSLLSGDVEVDDPGLRPGDRAVLAAVLDRHAIDQHPVQGAVALHQRRRIAARELAVGILQRLGRQVRIQPDERLAQPAFQHHVAVVRVAALRAGLARGDVRAVQHRVAERLEPGEGGVFDDGFGETAHGYAASSSRTASRWLHGTGRTS